MKRRARFGGRPMRVAVVRDPIGHASGEAVNGAAFHLGEENAFENEKDVTREHQWTEK